MSISSDVSNLNISNVWWPTRAELPLLTDGLSSMSGMHTIDEEETEGTVQKVDLRALKFQAYSEGDGDDPAVAAGGAGEHHTMGEDFDIDIEHENDESSVASSSRKDGTHHQIHVSPPPSPLFYNKNTRGKTTAVS